MEGEVFKPIVEHRFGQCQQLLNCKATEYSGKVDRLEQFKIAARVMGCTPEEALYGMWSKHLASVIKIIEETREGKAPSKLTINEKFSDAINYLVLLEGLLEERRTALAEVTGSEAKTSAC